MTKETPIGFAIIGTGAIGEIHASAIADVSGAELRAVHDRSAACAAAFVEKYPVRIEADLAGLLAATDIDVVCVSTPSGAHAEVAVPALNAGKHVFCEKPLEINVEQIDSMIEAAAANNRLLAAVFPSRLGIGAQTVKAAVEAGRVGRF